MHLLLLVGLLLHSSFGKTSERPLLLALTLAPLVRVVSLALPLGSVAPGWWYPLASLPLFVAGALAARTLSQSHTELRLHLGNLREQLGVALLGLPLAAVLSVVFVPLPSIAGVSGAVLVVSAIGILVCTGLVEEFLFRGVLQAAAQASLGSHWGLVYVSIVYAILHIGSLSMAVVVVSFGVGLAFAWLVARTGSLVGVSLAHGLANIGLYLIGPTISGAATGVVLSAALPLVTRLPAALLRVGL